MNTALGCELFGREYGINLTQNLMIFAHDFPIISEKEIDYILLYHEVIQQRNLRYDMLCVRNYIRSAR
jgi:hypothetical protein